MLDTQDQAATTQPPADKKLALVLCGGGILGSVQVGVLEALLEHGVTPDLIVGTSVGALNGAWLATYPTLEGVRRLKDVWLTLDRKSLFSEGRAKVLLRLLLGRDHVYTGKGIRELVCRHLGDTTFDTLKIPLYVTATEVETGELKVFSRGSLTQALMASTAIPGLLPAVREGNRSYVDGGFSGICSVETACVNGATSVVYIHSHPTLPEGFGVARPLARAISASLTRLGKLEVDYYKESCDLISLSPEVELPENTLGNFSRTGALIEASKAWTDNLLRNPTSKSLAMILNSNKEVPPVVGKVRGCQRADRTENGVRWTF